jgi:acetyl-CoA carboxylase carboxyltransferase component
MTEALARLQAIHRKNLAGGGAQHVERQHARGKLTARERIDVLIDPGTFRELGSCVNTTGQRIDGRETDAPGDGAVIGTALMEGRPVAVYASDFTVLGGSLGVQHGFKFIKLLELAADWGIPMVWLLDSSGGRLGYRDVPGAGIDWWFALQSRFSGYIPQINVLMGPCIAGQAYCPALCDFLLMSRGTGHLWLGGPRMTQAATAEKIGDDVGGADYHMTYSGTCDAVGDDDQESIRLARTLLGYLPSNSGQEPPRKTPTDDPARPTPELAEIVPIDPDAPYDVRRVIAALVDDGDYFEIKAEYAEQIVTCFARFDGRVTGLAANNPARPAGLDIDACDKLYRFLEVCDAYRIPLVTLVDTPTRVPGEDQEAKGLIRHLAKVIDVYATSTIPKISLVLRRAAADAGGIVLGMVKGMGVDVSYAWPLAEYTVEASVLDLRGRGDLGVEADAYEGYLNRSRETVDVFEAARSWTAQVVDEIIDPRDSRIKIIEALAVTRGKQKILPRRAKTHGCSPT